MGTLVAPMGSATVAMPAAMRWMDRHAALVLPARLNIVVDDVEADERARQPVRVPEPGAGVWPLGAFPRRV